MFGLFRKRDREAVFQDRMEKRFQDGVAADQRQKQEQKQRRDVTEVLREMEDYAKARSLTEWAEFTDRVRADGETKWLRVLLNPAAAYYFRCWLASYRRLLKQGFFSQSPAVPCGTRGTAGDEEEAETGTGIGEQRQCNRQ